MRFLATLEIICISFFTISLIGCKAESGSIESQLVQSTVHDKSSRYPGKPHAAVDMEYDLPESVSMNKVFNVELKFVSGMDADNLEIVVSTNENELELLDSQKSYSLGIQQKRQKNNITTSIMPKAEGLFYLNVIATLFDQGSSQSRSFAIPIKVGEKNHRPAMKSSGKQEQTESGERLIIMPALESTD